MTDLAIIPKWSTSVIEVFETCPWQYKMSIIDKKWVREWKGPEAEYGKDAHKRLEQRLKKRRPLPEDLEQMEPFCRELENWGEKLLVEHQMAVNRDMKPVGWFDKDAWGRAAADVIAIRGDEAQIIDWKTGNRVKFPELQSHILTFMTYIHFPQLKKVTTRFIYTKSGQEKGDTYNLEQDAAWLAREIVSRLKDIAWATKEGAWPKNPTGLCGWCPVKDCEHVR